MFSYSFDELCKKIKQYEGKRQFNGWGIREWSKLPGNELIDIWISELSITNSLTPVFMMEGSFRQKEMERELLSKSRVVLVPVSTIKYLNYGIFHYCFLYEVQPLEKVVPLHYHWRKLMMVKDYRWHVFMKTIVMKSVKYVHRCKISSMTKIIKYIVILRMPLHMKFKCIIFLTLLILYWSPTNWNMKPCKLVRFLFKSLIC